MTVAVITHDGIITPLDNSEITVSEREFVSAEGSVTLIDINLVYVVKIQHITGRADLKICDDINIVIERIVGKMESVTTGASRKHIAAWSTADKVIPFATD